MTSSDSSAAASRLSHRNCVEQTEALPGFAKRHAGACTPTKKPRKQPLPAAQKQHNRALARVRVRVEHVIRRFKIFRMFSGRDRDRRRRFGLRCNLIAGLLNYELAQAS